jgi:integrase
MTPRTASLRVAHQADCPHASKTSIDSVRRGRGGCKCQPSYYVMWRDASGATHKTPRVKDRRAAERARTKKQNEIDEGRAGVERVENRSFPDWADEYERILEQRGKVKGSTLRAYADTLRIARDTIGHVNVRAIGVRDLERFHERIAHTSPATQIKHLTQLSGCLAMAVTRGYADNTNALRTFRSELGLRAPKGTPPFTDGELARLLAALRHEEPVYLAIVRLAVETGARIGELIALEWEAVDLSGGKITIRHHYDAVDGLTLPKDRDARDVYLTPRATRVLGAWIRRVGVHEAGLVFAAPRSGGHVNADYLRKIILDAMSTAGIAKLDPQSGRPRKPLHSLRATFTRRMLEQGKHPQFVEAQLGHDSLALTVHTYGRWSDEAMRAEAAKG